MNYAEPVTLVGTCVRLEPLTLAHLDGLVAVGLDPDLWAWTPNQIETREDMIRYVEDALRTHREGTSLPFATIDRSTGQVAGCTRFGNIDQANRRVEIGWTWVARGWQRTPVNTEAKYLMLKHAFDTLGCLRVELKTDALNERSRRAMVRIGAKEEGTLRYHMVTANGRIRDTVYFSIIEPEWPGVRSHLEQLLARR